MTNSTRAPSSSVPGGTAERAGPRFGVRTAQYRELFRNAFQQALEVDSIADAVTRAEFLIGALWGALSQIRLTHDTAAAEPMSTIVIETIHSWTKAT